MADEQKLREYLKRVTVDLHAARSRLQALESGSGEPVAIVGSACRYPGGVGSSQELWELIDRGGDAISPFPGDRGWESWEGELRELGGGEMGARVGGFVSGVGDFDADFFEIPQAEAMAMDPQQRLLLETCWEAVEDAGIDPASLRGGDTGVFAGVGGQDYERLLMGAPSILAGYAISGNSASVVSGRVAYCLGLEGPAVTIDTACSSSLVALHLARGALQAGDCSLALVSGVTVLATPMLFQAMDVQGALAADGRCKAFAASADGIGCGEGAGTVVLELLSEARRRGHCILAVVRGSAVNQDGASNGLTAPSGAAQRLVIGRALADAGLTPAEVDAVEAHGTGTALGDPIEARALLVTYGRDRAGGEPLWLGSIKSNIGHTQAAGGLASLIKMTMALRHERLPRTLHVEAPSAEVDWSAGDVSLLCEPVAWPSGRAAPRRAAISSFGMSGTNVHVIVEEAPAPAHRGAVPPAPATGEPEHGLLDGGIVPCVVSGASAEALCEQARRLRDWIAARPELELADVGLSLALTRPALAHRAAVVAGELPELLAGLDSVARGEPAAGVACGVAGCHERSVAFVLPGLGSRWAGMGRELIGLSPLFAARVQACEQAFSAHLSYSVTGVLCGEPDAPPLTDPQVAQPALTALAIGLAGLWNACGVRARAIVGHSQGEMTAAHLAGGLSLADVARIVVLRGRAFASLAGKGTMAAVGLGAGEACSRLERYGGRVVLAAENGPCSTVLSGETRALEELVGECRAAGIRAAMISAAITAGHSPLLESAREALLEGCAGIAPRAGEVPFYSTVTARRMDTSELDAYHWYRNVREPVRFEAALRTLLDDGFRAFVELSPHPSLVLDITDTVDEALEDPREARAVGSLRRGEGGARRFLGSLCEAWTHGVEVDWRALTAPAAATVALPTYAFQRRRHWIADARRHGAGPPLDRLGRQPGQPGAQRGSLWGRLAAAAESQRGEIVLEAVCAQIAAVLGEQEAAAVDPDKGLLELGFNSLAAVELRNRLGAVVDLYIPTRVMFSRPCARELAAYIEARLPVSAPRAQGSRLASPPSREPGPGALAAMLGEAFARGRGERFLELLVEVSSFRLSFDAATAHEASPTWTSLCDGPAPVRLVCLPTLLALSGPHQFARMAAPLRGARGVSALMPPGFEEGELLPDSAEALARALAIALSAHAGEGPLALVGYSSGGWLAHDLAAELERTGEPAAALVLLDAYPPAPGAAAGALGAVLGRSLVQDAYGLVSDHSLTAMGGYLNLFADWRPAALATPTVLVRASAPLPGETGDGGWRTPWDARHDLIELDCDHLAMVEGHAEQTARAVHEWLTNNIDQAQEVQEACSTDRSLEPSAS